MAIDTGGTIDKVQHLDDLELALLLSIVANEHCLVEAIPEELDATEQRIKQIAARLFGLPVACFNCSEDITVDEFTNSLLVQTRQDPEGGSREPGTLSSSTPRSSRYGQSQAFGVGSVVIARNLGAASRQVQAQALELIRTGRVFTHTDVYKAPRLFLFIALNPIPGPRVFDHLNDLFFISHYHEPLRDSPYRQRDRQEAKGKAVSNGHDIDGDSDANESKELNMISQEDIETLVALRQEVVVTIEITRYMHDVLVFLRMHRAVAAGASPKATRHFELLTRCLAPCNGLGFVTPALVALAARKIYRHRLRLVTVEEERSMQYGSDPDLVAEYLSGLTPDLVIDEVLEEIEVPV